MKLCYRGIPYESNSVEIPTVETGSTARFMGNSYTVRRAAVNVLVSQKSGLVYRGVSSEEKEIKAKFLGRSYSRRRVFLVPINSEA